jgi:hypothetical protein
MPVTSVPIRSLTKLINRFKFMMAGPKKGLLLQRLLFGVSGGVLDATFAIGAESANAIIVTITALHEGGLHVGANVSLDITVFADAAGADFTAGTYTIAAGAVGKVAVVVTNKVVRGITGTGGVLNLSVTNAGVATCYIGVRLPSGRMVISGAVTHA